MNSHPAPVLAPLAGACTRLARALVVARDATCLELSHGHHGPAAAVRAAFADLVEAGLPLFSASLVEAGRHWVALQSADAIARHRRHASEAGVRHE
jgi:hypothetical protein